MYGTNNIKLNERVHLVDIDVDGTITLKWILKNYDGSVLSEFISDSEVRDKIM
jgi:uncharacterized HAD superfamily protein